MATWLKNLLRNLRGSFGKGYFPIEHELALRVALLRPILLVTGIGSTAYLLMGWLTPFGSREFPIDGFFWLIASGLSWILLRRENAIMASVTYIVIATQPLHYMTQSYGVASPINGLYLVGILICGLLVGNWFVGLWTIWYGIWMTIVGVNELMGNWTPSGGGWLTAAPLQAMQTLIGVLSFWWGAFILTGWLVGLISRHLERTVVVAHGQTSALARTLKALTGMPGLERFIGEALSAMAEQLEIEWATLFFYDLETDTVFPRMGFGEGRLLSEGEMRTMGPTPNSSANLPIWSDLIRSRQPIAIYDPANDPRLRNRALILSQGIQSILYVPLFLEEEIPGFLTINSIKPRHFSPQEIELAQALAQQISLAIQLTRMGEQANQTALLRERNRIAREIHDTLAQGFTGIVIQLEAAEDTLVDAPDAAQNHLARARTLARDSLSEARRSVWALRSEMQTDLVGALQRQAESLTAGTKISVQVTQEGLPHPLSPNLEQNLLRIGQEALTNALRHGKAERIRIQVSYASDCIELKVEDDGIGFDLELAKSHHGFGLIGMRERAQEMGGQLEVASLPEQGTVIAARFPLEVKP
jgi:signal transduction histidine kinase